MERFQDNIQEIVFDELKATDEILIHTENSEYRFSVIDPQQRQGILSGGSFGNQRREAVLLGSLSEGSTDHNSDLRALKTEARALFFLNSEKGFERIVTSPIKKLACVSGRQPTPRRATPTHQGARSASARLL